MCATNSGGYPAILQGLLGSNFSVTNYGNSGRTMLKRGLCGPPASGDCSYWDTPTWPAALDSTPDIVTIMLGTKYVLTVELRMNRSCFAVQQSHNLYFLRTFSAAAVCAPLFEWPAATPRPLTTTMPA